MDRELGPSAAAAGERLISDLRAKLREAEETLDAIRYGTVDAVLVKQSGWFCRISKRRRADQVDCSARTHDESTC